MLKIINGKLITPEKIVEKSLYITENKISAITDENLEYDTLIDADGNYISPGFIDMHTHGGGGYDFMDGGVEPILSAAEFHLKHGTTSILPTTVTADWEGLKQAVLDVKEAMRSCPTILGIHLEGPYFSAEQGGAQNPDYLRSLQREEYIEMLELGKDVIKRWDFAPELDGSEAFCQTLLDYGVVPSVGHSNATYEEVLKVYRLGCRLVTHLYSGMSSITRSGGFRKLGVIESAYLLDEMDVEIIADGCHLPPELLQLICKCKDIKQISLITDAIRGAGFSSGKCILGRKQDGTECIIEDGVAKLPDRTAFAGSIATADRLLRVMVQDAGIPLNDAIRMMTENPARVLGLKNKGKLQEGHDADLVFFDEKINLKRVMYGGNFFDKVG